MRQEAALLPNTRYRLGVLVLLSAVILLTAVASADAETAIRFHSPMPGSSRTHPPATSVPLPRCSLVTVSKKGPCRASCVSALPVCRPMR